MTSINGVNARRITVLVAAAICLESCIIVPIPRPPAKDEVFIPQETIDEIEIGKTDSRELQLALGDPDWSFDSGSRLVYKTRILSPGQIGTCVIVAVPAGFGAFGGGSCNDRRYETELLDIAFDSHGTVIRRDVFVPDVGECTATGVCLYEYGGMKVYSSEDRNKRAKEVRVEPGLCAIFLYTWKPARPDTSVRFQVDGNEYPYWFLSDSDFFRVELIEGPHTIGATVNWLEGVRPDSIALNCESPIAYFVRVLIDGSEGASFGLVPADEGRREILGRDFVLTRDYVANDRYNQAILGEELVEYLARLRSTDEFVLSPADEIRVNTLVMRHIGMLGAVQDANDNDQLTEEAYHSFVENSKAHFKAYFADNPRIIPYYRANLERSRPMEQGEIFQPILIDKEH